MKLLDWLLEKYIGWAFNNPGWAIGTMIMLNFIIWGGIVFVAIHFISKYW